MTTKGTLLGAYAADAVVHLLALGWDVGWLAVVTKLALVPLLLAWVVVVGRPAPRLLVLGLALAWVGDVVLELPGDAAFVVGILFFLAMQVCYISGFLGMGAAEVVLRRRPWIVVAYAIVWITLCLWLAAGLGALRWPVVFYSVVLATMAALAAGVSPRVALGGLLFLVSDALIAVRVAEHDFAGRSVVVMATYVVAQYLIADGWLRRTALVRVGGSGA